MIRFPLSTVTLILFFFPKMIHAQFGQQIDISKSAISMIGFKVYDLDEDSDMDVLATTWSGDKVVWYRNLGGGTFSEQLIITDEILQGRDVFASDLDGDGDLDVLSASKEDTTVAWYENLGGGDFGNQHIVSIESGEPEAIFAIDLDGDDDMDIIAAVKDEDRLLWYENLGMGTFGSEQVISTEIDKPESIYLSDLDGDGDPDLLSASFDDDKVAWYENLGGGDFGEQNVLSIAANGAESVHAADLDGDGDMDVVSTSLLDDKVAWYENLGTGVFADQVVISTAGNNPQSIYASDFDNDGDLDLVFAVKIDDQFAWIENLGGGLFGEQEIIDPDANNAERVYPADMDGDGLNDFVSYHVGQVSFFKNLGGGLFDEPVAISAPPTIGAQVVHASDIDGDSDLDILFGLRAGIIGWYENFGEDGYGQQQIISDNTPDCKSVYAADLDGDGDMDALSTSWNDSKIGWYENLGGGEFGSETEFTTLFAWRANAIFAADLDGDGDSDVLSAWEDGKVLLNENLSGGTFSVGLTITSSLAIATGVYAADLDLDGDLDILASGWADEKIVWYENLGDLTFSSENVITLEAGMTESVYAADLDGDGDMDALSGAHPSSDIAWYENLGDGTFGDQQLISGIDDAVGTVYASDLDLDGDMDVLSSGESGGIVSWYENTGDGTFGVQQIITAKTSGVRSAIAADMNGDGDSEILTASKFDHKIAMHENYFIHSYKLKGKIFFDTNENGVLDDGETGGEFMQLELTPSETASYSAEDGSYFFSVHPGTYTVNYAEDTLWTLTTDPSSYTETVTDDEPIFDELNFGFYPDTIITRISPNVIGGFPRCNTTVNYWLDFRNDGTTQPSGVVHLELAEDLDYVGAEITPDSIVGQNIYWHYDSLFFYSSEMINVQVEMPSFTSIGDTLTSFLNVHELDSLGSGAFTYSNSDTLNQILVCAYDPNDKYVTPQGVSSEGYIRQDQELEYLIRFQNTGTDTAITVLIKDQLDENLDWNTFTPLANSHEMEAWVDEDGEVNFLFENIMLPDSNVNEIASHGFVLFSILPDSGLATHTEILNTAEIYFDENPAIVTNTELNTIYDCEQPIDYEISDLFACFGDTIVGVVSDLLPTSTFEWEISGVISTSESEFYWMVDTAGVFDLTVRTLNEVCNKEISTLITIYSLPETSIAPFDPDTLCDISDEVLLPVGTPAGGVYSGEGVTGTIFSAVDAGLGLHEIFYTFTDENACMNWDRTTIYITDCLGIDEIGTNDGIFIYPNPTKGQFKIQKQRYFEGDLEIKIIDLKSQVVFLKTVADEQPTVEIDIRHLSQGVYYVRLIVGENMFLSKVIKE